MKKLEARLRFLQNNHKKQHNIIEALEAEKAPEEIIKNHKRLKLSLKDEITELESKIKGLQNVG